MKFSFFILAMFQVVFAQANTCKELPAEFDDNRIYLNVKAGKHAVRIYTDSGGGLFPFIYDDTAEKLSMKIENTVHEEKLAIGLSTFGKGLETQGIPIPPSWKGKVRVFTFQKGGSDEASESRFFLGDGFFGASFFADKIWSFNYPKHILAVCGTLGDIKNFKPTPMHFKSANSNRANHQPRIEIEVEGQKLSVLFDTGATSLYSDSALKQVRVPRAYTASSFIRESVAQKWMKANPKWRLIKGGEKFAGGGDLIEVPKLKIAGVEVGPVWFATRKDPIYDQYSEKFMDSRIDGAVGGNLFSPLELVVDYPQAKLFVRKSAL